MATLDVITWPKGEHADDRPKASGIRINVADRMRSLW
jgi:hypothetical protein